MSRTDTATTVSDMAVAEYEYENWVDEFEDIPRVCKFHWSAHQFNRKSPKSIGYKATFHAIHCFVKMIKYAFVMAARLALWLSHDVESNPGPRFDSRTCLELVVRNLSEVLRSQLSVSGSLWSESVACAAHAAGYSRMSTWNNPSGKNKGSISQLIERASELGRLLKSMDCLPNELDPFVFRLDEEEIRRRLAIHFKIENLKTAVNVLLDETIFSSEESKKIIQIINGIKPKIFDGQNNIQLLGYVDCDVNKTAHINIADPEGQKSGNVVHSDVSGSIDTTTPMRIGQPLESDNACRRMSKRALNPGYNSVAYVGVAKTSVGPGTFSIRYCIKMMIKYLSAELRYHLPVCGTLWSESVAEAAYAAGYSTDCQWSNPSGNKKEKLTTLIKRATELGRVLTTLDCLPADFAPFINDLGNCAIQEQLVFHFIMKNFRSAVDIVLGVRSFGFEQKSVILQEIQRLKQISEEPHTSHVHMNSGCICTSTDFQQLADSNTTHKTDCYQKKTVRRKPKRVQHIKEHGNLLDKSQNSSLPEPKYAVTIGQHMDQGSDGINDNDNIHKLDGTSSTVSKVQEVIVEKSMATFLSARSTSPDRSSTFENQTFSVGTKESKPVGSTGESISIMNDILESNMTINQTGLLDDILIWLNGTESQVYNEMEDDARNTDMPRTATNYPGLTQLQVTEVAYISNSGSIPTGQGHEANVYGSGVEESSMIINPDITERDKVSDSTLQGKTGQGGTTNCLHRDRDNLTQEKEEAEEHRIGNDDSVEKTSQGKQIAKTESQTELLQQTIFLQATGSNSGHKVASVGGGRKGAEDDTCENEAKTLSSGGEQFTAAETETEPIQQTVSPLAAVKSSYSDTERDEMYREETVDDNTFGTWENQAEDLTLGSEQFASTEPADTRKQRMEPTVDEHFAKFKELLIKEFEDRLDAFKATLGNNTPNEHVLQNENGEPLDCASSDVEHTEPRVRFSDTSRKRNQTDPENGPTSKKWRQ